MKIRSLLILILALFCSISLTAQTLAYREGEVLVKFRTDYDFPQKIKNNTASIANGSLEVIFAKLGVYDFEDLGTDAIGNSARHGAKSQDGLQTNGLCLLKFEADSITVSEAVSLLTDSQVCVEYAEPNYIFHTQVVEEEGIAYDDPLYPQQWGISAVNLPELWKHPVINRERPIIAIIDTGVDIYHPDITENIWTNPTPKIAIKISSNEKISDDLHGWDFINNCSAERDNNGHGTHCAGIAGASGNNGKGIVGANPDAWIMPVTVMQSNGQGDAATIIKGIKYAVARGADILSMSLGTEYYSKAMEDALMEAYASCYIVAAAGNSGKDVNKTPTFPGALPFVLGVMASDESGRRASFSNLDDDGPLSSKTAGMYNYEVMAPGTNVLSTFPNGQYKILQGTSMACPLVAGALSALMQRKKYKNNDYMMRDLIGSSSGVVDFDRAYTIEESDFKPSLQIAGITIVDEDGDGRMDAGETVCIYPIVKNMSGKAFGIVSSITLNGDEDAKWITVLEDNAAFEYTLDSYASATSKNPIKIKISEDCPDTTEAEFYIKVTCPEALFAQKNFSYEVESGIEIGGSLTENLTLYPGKHYILTSDMSVPEGITVNLEPGTVLKMKPGKKIFCSGVFNAIGTKEHPIFITTADPKKEKSLGTYGARLTIISGLLEYVTFDNLYGHPIISGENKLFGNNNWINVKANHCIIRNCIGRQIFDAVHFTHSAIYNNETMGFHGNSSGVSSSNYTGFDKNGDLIGLEHSNYINNKAPAEIDALYYANCFNNARGIYNPTREDYDFVDMDVMNTHGDVAQMKLRYVYMGSCKVDMIKEHINDIDNSIVETSYLATDLTNLLLQPDAEAPGIVWKVLVDDCNPYDEADKMLQIGVGRHKVEVYFNKPMLPDSIPTISMGLSNPYRDVLINENGSWSSDNSVYTAYFTLIGNEDIDGTNIIHVSGAMDCDGFAIPVEEKRFQIIVQSAGALETGLVAETGVACVKLKWETTEDTKGDVMGYNIYRYESLNNGSTDVQLINSPVVDASVSEYIDDKVIVGKTYYYYLREISTDLREFYTSNVVAATPKTAKMGDANASDHVDVADIITEVSYILGETPKPFIFDAADVINDKTINVLDVIGTVNIIMDPLNMRTEDSGGSATYSVEDGLLYLDSSTPLGGIQILVETNKENEPTATEALGGMEVASTWIDDKNYLFMAYSMSGRCISSGRQAVLHVGDGVVKNLILSDPMGKNIEVAQETPTEVINIENAMTEFDNGGKSSVEITDIAGRSVTPNTITHGIYIVREKVNGKVLRTRKMYKK